MTIKDLASATPDELRAEVDRLGSAIQRARYCLEDGRRVGDAIQILKVAVPRLTVPPTTGGTTPKRSA